MKISKAAICSILLVGLGQIYNQDYRKAIMIWLLDFFLLFFMGPFIHGLVGIPVFIVFVYSIYDALKNDKKFHKK